MPNKNNEQQFEVAERETAQSLVDVDGYARKAYEFKPGQRIALRGGYETPTFDKAEGAITLVEATPIGAIDLAVYLSEDNSDTLAELRERIEAGRIGGSEKAFLDALAATVYEDSEGLTEQEMGDRFILFAQFLAGDPRARTFVQNAIQQHHESEMERRKISEIAYEKASHHVLVRTTNNEPIIRNGVVMMLSASAYSGDVPRSTVHFSVDHLVASHMEGVIETTKYTVVAPLDSALQANGKPASLTGVDTFFTHGPGEAVALPRAVVIESNTSQKELYRESQGKVSVKVEGFGANIQELIERFSGEYTHFEVVSTMYSMGLIKKGESGQWDDTERALAVLPKKAFDSIVGDLNRRLAINKVIKRSANEVAVSDGQSTFTTIDKDLMVISESMGVGFRHHSDTDYSYLEDHAMAIAENKGNFEVNSRIARVDAATQRLYLLRGFLQVARKAPKVELDSGV